MTKPIHIAVDVRPLSRNTGGIRRYLECLLPQMIKNKAFKFSLYSDGPIENTHLFNHENVSLRTTLNTSSIRKLFWQLHISKWLKQDKPDIFWSPRHHIPRLIPKDILVVVTIHDVIWKTHPNTLEHVRLINEKISMPHAIKKSDMILVPSKSTADEIIKYWPAENNKIHNIQHGATQFPKNLNQQKIHDNEYFLAVGTIEPRKNYARLIRAFDAWSEENTNIDLVIVGQTGWKQKEFRTTIEQCKHGGRIHILKDADDLRLANLYSNAMAFIQVSLAEGFGMPVAEARIFGLPVLISDIPVFREFFDQQCLWVDPKEMESIKQGLTELNKKTSGESQSVLPSWCQVSSKTLVAFKQLVSMHVEKKRY